MLRRIFANSIRFITHTKDAKPMIRFCEVGACKEHADVVAKVKGWRTAFEQKPVAVCNACIPKLAADGHDVLIDEPATPAKL